MEKSALHNSATLNASNVSVQRQYEKQLLSTSESVGLRLKKS